MTDHVRKIRSRKARVSRFSAANAEVDELREHYAQTLKPVIVSPLSGHCSVSVRDLHISLGDFDVWAGNCSSGMNVSFTEPPDLYALYLPISGAMEFQRNNQMTTSSPGALLACDLARVDKLFLREERSHVGIAFNRLTLARHLSELIDAPVDPHFELFGQVDVAQDKGWLSTMCMQVWSSLEADPERGAIARSNEMILRAIMVRLLETVPHQYSHLLNRRSSCAVPRHVKLAIDFMVANVAAPLTIEEIASATAVSVRSLQTAFQRFKNMTPLVYLRQLRLDQARLELQTTTDEYASVRSIANRWGFSNVSRFSEVYVRTFGEAASETLARRK